MVVILEMLVLMTYLLNMNNGCSTKKTIDCLTDNIVERLKVSLIERSFHNQIYESNTRNSDFYYSTFDGDERLITRRQIYHINDIIVFRLSNGFSVYI